MKDYKLQLYLAYSLASLSAVAIVTCPSHLPYPGGFMERRLETFMVTEEASCCSDGRLHILGLSDISREL